MEALLSPRLKDVAALLLGATLAVAAAWTALAPAPPPVPAAVQAQVESDFRRIDAALERLLRESVERSGQVASAYGAKRLAAAGMEKREALVEVRDGVIVDYVGEIYFFKPVELAEGDWQLTRKNDDVYFQRRVGADRYYLRFLLNLRAGPLRGIARGHYPVFNLRHFASPPPLAADEFTDDQAQGRFYATRVFPAARGQLVLSIVLSREELGREALRRRRLVAAVLAFLLFLLLALKPGGAAGVRLGLRLLAIAGMGAAAWRAVGMALPRDVFFPGPGRAVRSVFQLLIAFCFLASGARLALRKWRPQNNLLALAVFNLAAAAAFAAIGAVLQAADFPSGGFSLRLPYLGLLALVLGLAAAPLLAAFPLLRPAPAGRLWPLLLLQAVLVLLGSRWLGVPLAAAASLALGFAVVLLQPRRAWLRFVAPLLLLPLAVSLWLGERSLQAKRNFISGNLRPVFSSQDDYAKLVAREVVFELNALGIPFSAFFTGGAGAELPRCWDNTLAAREDIPSGIYVVSGEGRLLHSFSFQIPYIPLPRRDLFPFWLVENVDAELFGKKVRLAVATISVFQGERLLGYVMVQVLNTADLALRSQEPQSVLRADRRILDADIGYITLDEEGHILENPANINVPGLGELARSGAEWVSFLSMGVAYEGGVFRGGERTAVVFFPRSTFFASVSEFVKVLGFLLLLASPVGLRRLRRYPWRPLVGSFSVKVFAILVLLSIFTAGVFSVFALNFNNRSQETRRIQAAHRRGRSALAIVDNLLAAGGEITQTQLFLLDKVIETGISVYENGALLYTSDHRQLLRSELPVYLNSGVRDRLRDDVQPFDLRRDDDMLDLYFRSSGGYVFRLQFPADSAEQLRARRYYVDFMVTIFFVLIALGLAAAFFFRGRIMAPIHRLNTGMAAVQRGDLQPLDDVPSEVELRELYQGFNSMLEGIQEQKRSASEIARMKTLVQLGRRVAHEVKNPLTPIRLSAEQIQRSLQDGGEKGRQVIADAVRYIIEETEHLRRVAFGFLNLSKLDELKAEAFALDGLVGEAVSRLRPLYPRVRFSLAGGAGEVRVVADRQKIRQAVDNVLTNGLEAVAGGDGEISVRVGEEGEWAVVRVQDNGVGIGAEELQRIAREEFSSKELGTGLGLVIARRFLELHRGGLEIESLPGRGTTVVMRFAKHAQPS